MLFKLSNLNSNLALTLGYLKLSLKNSAQISTFHYFILYPGKGGHTLILPKRVHVCAAEQGVVFTALSLRQGIHFSNYLAS